LTTHSPSSTLLVDEKGCLFFIFPIPETDDGKPAWKRFGNSGPEEGHIEFSLPPFLP
jgi:hypothetical protein